MSARNLTLPPQQQALKTACRQLIRAFGGQEAAGEELGCSQSRLSDWGNPNTADFMPVGAVLRLEAATHGTAGHPHVSSWLARAAGFVLVRLPNAPSGAGSWHQAMGRVAKDVGEVMERICTALSDDGAVSAREVRDGKVIEEIDQAIEQLVAMRALAVATIEGEG